MVALLCVLAAVLLLLCLPLSLWVSWEEKPELSLHWLFFTFPLAGARKKKKKKRPGGKKSGPSAAKKAPVPKPPADKKQPELKELLSLALELCRAAAGGGGRMLLGSLRVTRLELLLTVAGEDAAQTAVSCGQAAAWLHSGLGALRSYVRIQDPQVEIRPDFLGEHGGFRLHLRVAVTPLIALAGLLRVGGVFLWRMARKPPRGQDQDQSRPRQKGPAEIKEC